MKKGLFGIALVVAMVFALSTISAANHVKPPPGKHYNLNIIGFAQCKKNGPEDPDCFKGNAGDIETHGHTIFVPLETQWMEDPCDSDAGNYYGDPVDIQVAELKKGVRILVSDGGGGYDKIQPVDRDATDGTGMLIIPDGCYLIYARPLGTPGGCMDIDTIICYDFIEVEEDVWDFVQVDCDPTLNNDKYILVGHLDVDRTREDKKPRWTNATDQLLPVITGVGNGDPGYLDFFWQIFNNNLRLLQLRLYKVDCPAPDPDD